MRLERERQLTERSCEVAGLEERRLAGLRISLLSFGLVIK